MMHLINELESHLSNMQSILRDYKEQIKYQLIILNGVRKPEKLQLNSSLSSFFTYNSLR